MPTIYQTDNPSNCLTFPALEIIRKEITDAYFASSTSEPEYEGTEEIYTVVAGDNLQKIATLHKTTAELIKTRNNLKSDSLKVGQNLTIGQKKLKGNKLSFEQINSANMGDEVYIIVETGNADGLDLKISIKQGGADGIEKLDMPVSIMQDNTEVSTIKATVGIYAKDNNIINKDDFKDLAIAKISLRPKDEDKLEQWNDNLEKLKGKKSRVYLIIEPNSSEVFMLYTTPGTILPPHWLNEEDKHFEIKQCCLHGIEFKGKIECQSSATKVNYGPIYWGNKRTENYKDWDKLIKEKKLTKDEKEIINWMSPNEGKLDSVQSYDSEALTAGAMQKTINTKGSGQFSDQLYEFKVESPDVFNKYIKNCCGWSVEKINKDCITYYKKPDGTKITGEELKKYLREGFNKNNFKTSVDCPALLPIINLISAEDFIRKQILDFKAKLDKIGEFNISGYNTKDWFKTNFGMAIILDHYVNRPSWVKSTLEGSINEFFEKKDKEVEEYNKGKSEPQKKQKISRNPNEWGINHGTYEDEIIEIYGVKRKGTDMPDRFTKIKKRAGK